MTFRVDYNVPSINRDFGTVFLGDKNVGMLVVGEGWAKVENHELSSRLAMFKLLIRFWLALVQSCSCRSENRGNRKEKWVLTLQNCYDWKNKLSKKALVVGARFVPDLSFFNGFIRQLNSLKGIILGYCMLTEVYFIPGFAILTKLCKYSTRQY